MLSTPLCPDGAAAEHLQTHGDGVRDIAFHVDDADAAFEEAVRRGAEPAIEPRELQDDHGPRPPRRDPHLRRHDPLVHLVRRLQRPVPARLRARETSPGEEAGILRVDHIVGNVELGKMDDWADWYSRVLGFKRFISFDDKDISTEYSALMSIVMSDDSHAIKFPINEPAAGQAQEPDSGISRLLPRPGRAAHRAADDRHHAHGRRAARRTASSS